MKTWWHETPLRHQPVARCSECHQLIVEVPEVGWLDPDVGDAYDMCEVNPYGNHSPGPVLTSPRVVGPGAPVSAA